MIPVVALLVDRAVADRVLCSGGALNFAAALVLDRVCMAGAVAGTGGGVVGLRLHLGLGLNAGSSCGGDGSTLGSA